MNFEAGDPIMQLARDLFVEKIRNSICWPQLNAAPTVRAPVAGAQRQREASSRTLERATAPNQVRALQRAGKSVVAALDVCAHTHLPPWSAASSFYALHGSPTTLLGRSRCLNYINIHDQ